MEVVCELVYGRDRVNVGRKAEVHIHSSNAR